jgi:hypothetical protein
MGRTLTSFSANRPPSAKGKKKKTAVYKVGKSKYVRSAEKAERKALIRALIDGKLSYDVNEDAIEGVKCIEEEASKMAMETRLAMGLLVVLQEGMRVALKVCYVVEFEEPDEDKWPAIFDVLSSRFAISSKVVKQVFTACHEGVKNPEKK